MSQDGASSPNGRVALLAMTFCISMTLMNVVIEHATLNVQTLDVPTLGNGITLGQFFFCSLCGLACGGQLLPPTKSEDGIVKTFAPFVLLAFLIFCGTGLPNIAVGWVQYPVMVVFKTSKLVPVMLVSGVMGNSRVYNLREYLAAALICIGTAGFAWNPGKDTSSADMAVIGIVLLTVAALSDAFSSNLQQKLMNHVGVDPMTVMARLNFVGFIGVLAFQLFSGEAGQIFQGVQQEPIVLAYFSMIGLMLSCGAWANINLINESGAVLTVGLATLRKALTIVLSYILYPKPLSYTHIGSAMLVFAGLLLSDVAHAFGNKSKGQDKEEGEEKCLSSYTAASKV